MYVRATKLLCMIIFVCICVHPRVVHEHPVFQIGLPRCRTMKGTSILNPIWDTVGHSISIKTTGLNWFWFLETFHTCTDIDRRLRRFIMIITGAAIWIKEWESDLNDYAARSLWSRILIRMWSLSPTIHIKDMLDKKTNDRHTYIQDSRTTLFYSPECLFYLYLTLGYNHNHYLQKL